ncbi:MAG: F0F1 ATP synthase subunit delta [Sulfurovum sp.]|nr:MAG: F0F1 ATP synthase subunit delta [Sulfurovum sp.]RUM72475.1 MAG: F0F1 ATP synthase subunit delta [Sulfurovum sp.]
MEELIAKRYVQALSSTIKNKEEAAIVLDTLAMAIKDEKIQKVLLSPVVSDEKKTEMILAALDKNVDASIVNFIKILGENKRLDLIPVIANVLNTDLQKASNNYAGVVKSNETLNAKTLSQLEETLEKYTGSAIKLAQDKSDFDGLRVIVNDLGIEVNFSKQRVKEQLIDFIKKSL